MVESGQSDQGSTMSDMDQKATEAIKRNKEVIDEEFKSYEKHPRCAILPSPEELRESIGSSGSDKTATLRDFDLMKKWATKSELLEFHNLSTTADSEAEFEQGSLDEGQYYGFISLAFSTAFAAMRNTASPDLEELVFWYYAGHGLSTKAAQKLLDSSTPCLGERPNDRVKLNPEYNAAANKYVTKGRKVKGGELYLHKVGFCDLYGLLKPWIAAVKEESINAKGCSKKNKHLAIILDSCYSGIIAQELKDFEKKMNEEDPNFLKENSVTIQAACGSDESTFGGYFTPTFVYLNGLRINAELLNDPENDPESKNTVLLNDPENDPESKNAVLLNDPENDPESKNTELLNNPENDPESKNTELLNNSGSELSDPESENAKLLNELKAEWIKMTHKERAEYKALELPSPMVVTTRPQSQDVTMELKVQNFKLTLFPDPGFFRFCSIRVYQHQDKSWYEGKDRVLGHISANDFMNSPTFTVLDYKLKTMGTGPYAGSPMGLFLLKDPTNQNYAVCAHIHFQRGNTNNAQRINLVHHKKPPVGSVLYTEDHDGLSCHQISRHMHKIEVSLDDKGKKLVKACRDYVTTIEPHRWNCISQWNMESRQLGVNGKFRVHERLRERSAWEDSYLQHI